MKIKIDRQLCQGLGNCVAIAPLVFQLDEENKVIVVDASAEDENTITEAAMSCPYKAIIIEDDEGHQLYP